MKICLVTTFPPSQGGLSEYGLHIAEQLRRDPFLSLTVLADELSEAQPELPGFSVERCWSFDNPLSSIRLLREIRRVKPDVVWFNLLFSTFGRKPVVAFAGLLTPMLARLMGCYTHVTLHHLMDTVDLKDAGVKHARVYRTAGAFATRLLLLSNSVSVLMPGYRKILHEKYGRDNVHVRSHGILTTRPEPPDFSRRGNPEHRILAFGKWGTYKKLELMVEAFQEVSAKLPNARLVIAGGNHPQAAGYVESIKEKWAHDSRIEFTGYLDEERLPDIFQGSSVAVMPYSSSTGCSGVAHLACAYGVPIICADLPDFRQMADGEDIAIDFYQPGQAQDLARCLVEFLTNPAKQEAMAMQNFASALRMTMPTIVQKYLRHFELHQRAEALRHVTRFRRLPAWMPSKSRLLRIITRNSLGWVYRSPAVNRPMRNGFERKALLDNQIHDSTGSIGTRRPLNGDGEMRRFVAGGTRRDSAGLGYGSAGNGNHSDGEDGGHGEHPQPASAWPASYESDTSYAERKQPGAIKQQPLPPTG
jgi:glycosyltransferase involved in cell wall biosynthesis